MMNEECNLDVLTLEHYAPEDFEQCIFQSQSGVNVLYLIFLRLLDLYFMGMIISDFILDLLGPNEKSLIFFDFWTLMICTTPALYLHGIVRNCHDQKDHYDVEYLDHMPWSYKIYWISFSVALPATILSSIAFWTQVYKSQSGLYRVVLNTVSPFLIICNFLLVAFPLRMLHFFFFVIFYTAYILFTLIYEKCGGTGVDGSVPIYKDLDWRYPAKAVLAAFVGLVIGVGLYLLFCFISMGKLWLRSKYLYRDY